MTPTEKETLRRVYQDELRDLQPQLRAALEGRTETELARMEAQRRHENAVHRYAALEGRMDTVRELAAREGITLD